MHNKILLSLLGLALFLTGQAYGQKTVTLTAPTSAADVNSAINGGGVGDGDTVVIPAQTIEWTSKVSIPAGKSLTIRGNCPNDNFGQCPNAADRTVIKDNAIRGGLSQGFFGGTIGATQYLRISGIQFIKGSATVTLSGGMLSFGGTSNRVRVDHCLFDNLLAGYNIEFTGTVYGVADHNKFICGAIMAELKNGDSTSGVKGWQAWSDFPWFGSPKFMFFEDNESTNIQGTLGRALPDGTNGARYVFRRNLVHSANFAWHGSEVNYTRGTRAVEIYQNRFDRDGGTPTPTLFTPANIRSAAILYHNNQYTGIGGAAGGWNLSPQVFGLNVFRSHWQNAKWFGPGTSLFDKVVTEADGTTWISGNAHRSFLSGNHASSGASGTRTVVVLPTPSPAWSPGQWVSSGSPAYYLVNTNPLSPFYGGHAPIDSSGPNTLTTTSINQEGPECEFNPGDHFDVYKVIKILDQPGMGKGIGWGAAAIPSPSVFPNSTPEPCYSWNNGNHGAVYEFFSYTPTIVEGTDYVNLHGAVPDLTAAPIPAPTPVAAKYKAILNGQDYTQTFTYPHPCVNDWPNCSTAPSAPVFANGASDGITATIDTPFSYIVTASGNPTPTFTPIPTGWPGGVSFTDQGLGNGKLAGTPTGTPSNTTKTITAHGTAPDATQSFTLTVKASPTPGTPGFTSPNTTGTTFMAARSGDSFGITTSGSPVATITQTSGTLPSGLTFTATSPVDGTATISGTPATANGTGVDIGLHADNGSTADQTLKVIVQPSPTPAGTGPTPAIIQIHP